MRRFVVVAHVTKWRLHRYEQMRQRDSEVITRMVLHKDIPGKRFRGRWTDDIRRDVKRYRLDDQMTEDRKVWSMMAATVDTRRCTRPEVRT